jgi:hypothetical protein
MKWYHGTNKKAWELIKKERLLFGFDRFKHDSPRKTYLAADMQEAKCYGDVLLEVEYNPLVHPEMNNYVPDCWQIRVYEPIPIKNIKCLKE